MATRHITRCASAAVVTGIALVTLAAPASAQYAKEPASGGFVDDSTVIAPAPIDPRWEAGQLATSALAGLALAAGIAGAAGMAGAGIRRHQHTSRPV